MLACSVTPGVACLIPDNVCDNTVIARELENTLVQTLVDTVNFQATTDMPLNTINGGPVECDTWRDPMANTCGDVGVPIGGVEIALVTPVSSLPVFGIIMAGASKGSSNPVGPVTSTFGAYNTSKNVVIGFDSEAAEASRRSIAGSKASQQRGKEQNADEHASVLGAEVAPGTPLQSLRSGALIGDGRVNVNNIVATITPSVDVAFRAELSLVEEHNAKKKRSRGCTRRKNKLKYGITSEIVDSLVAGGFSEIDSRSVSATLNAAATESSDAINDAGSSAKTADSLTIGVPDRDSGLSVRYLSLESTDESERGASDQSTDMVLLVQEPQAIWEAVVHSRFEADDRQLVFNVGHDATQVSELEAGQRGISVGTSPSSPEAPTETWTFSSVFEGLINSLSSWCVCASSRSALSANTRKN